MKTWFLGAGDPEMERIRWLLASCGESVEYALTTEGRRVRPDEAYRASSLAAGEDGDVVFVECAVLGIVPVRRVDHHHAGDPGFGRGPEEFLPASSLGQVITFLARERSLPEWDSGAGCGREVAPGTFLPVGGRWEVALGVGGDAGASRRTTAIIPLDLVLASAADHCLAAAYRGGCPGVDPGSLADWRDEVRAKFQRRPVAAVRDDRERAEVVLRAAPRLWLASEEVADLRDAGQIPELPEAAARLGIPFLAVLADGRTGAKKLVLQSSAGPAVEGFLAGWAAQQGIVNLYGDPARGFAGGRLP